MSGYYIHHIHSLKNCEFLFSRWRWLRVWKQFLLKKTENYQIRIKSTHFFYYKPVTWFFRLSSPNKAFEQGSPLSPPLSSNRTKKKKKQHTRRLNRMTPLGKRWTTKGFQLAVARCLASVAWRKKWNEAICKDDDVTVAVVKSTMLYTGGTSWNRNDDKKKKWRRRSVQAFFSVVYNRSSTAKIAHTTTPRWHIMTHTHASVYSALWCWCYSSLLCVHSDTREKDARRRHLGRIIIGCVAHDNVKCPPYGSAFFSFSFSYRKKAKKKSSRFLLWALLRGHSARTKLWWFCLPPER